MNWPRRALLERLPKFAWRQLGEEAEQTRKALADKGVDMGAAMGIDDDCDILIVFDASVENTATETLGKPSKRCPDHIKESYMHRNTIATPIYEMQRATIELDAIRRHLQTSTAREYIWLPMTGQWEHIPEYKSTEREEELGYDNAASTERWMLNAICRPDMTEHRLNVAPVHLRLHLPTNNDQRPCERQTVPPKLRGTLTGLTHMRDGKIEWGTLMHWDHTSQTGLIQFPDGQIFDEMSEAQWAQWALTPEEAAQYHVTQPTEAEEHFIEINHFNVDAMRHLLQAFPSTQMDEALTPDEDADTWENHRTGGYYDIASLPKMPFCAGMSSEDGTIGHKLLPCRHATLLLSVGDPHTPAISAGYNPNEIDITPSITKVFRTLLHACEHKLQLELHSHAAVRGINLTKIRKVSRTLNEFRIGDRVQAREQTGRYGTITGATEWGEYDVTFEQTRAKESRFCRQIQEESLKLTTSKKQITHEWTPCQCGREHNNEQFNPAQLTRTPSRSAAVRRTTSMSTPKADSRPPHCTQTEPAKLLERETLTLAAAAAEWLKQDLLFWEHHKCPAGCTCMLPGLDISPREFGARGESAHKCSLRPTMDVDKWHHHLRTTKEGPTPTFNSYYCTCGAAFPSPTQRDHHVSRKD